MKAYPFLLLAAIITFDACTKSDSINSATVNTLSALSQPLPNVQVDSAVSRFMNKYQVPGLAIAISKEGKMVYLKGFGYADETTKAKVSGNSLFRIAGLSKTFTAVAVLKLLEDNRLTLDAKVFGAEGILGNMFGTLPYNNNLVNITVRELLQQTTGGWADDATDPMFTNPTYSQSQLISWTLDNRPLSVLPNTHYVSSNFGYLLLGRIIEKITKVSYKDYVNVKVLEPCGIRDMQLAKNTTRSQVQNEVTYYGESDENPYAFNIGRMDAHGGWMASAEDLLKFLVSTDGFSTKVDLLSASSIGEMTTPSAANPNYGLGWNVNSAGNWWNISSLPGSSAEIVRTSGGFCWTILCNTNRTSADYFADMDNIIWSVINNKMTEWPASSIDLF